jgi:protein-tyrosine phosphatase
MNRIRDSLFISNAPSVRDLPDDHDFDEVVTLGYLDSFGYERPAASTTNDEFVFPDGPHDYERFEAAVEYVLNALDRGDRVLVHCQAGVSRSGGVCSVVLADHDDMSLSDALRDVQAARDVVNPAPEIRDSMTQYTGDDIDQPAVGYNNL